MPANSISEEATGAEITAHAWLDYAGKCYPKFLASEDFEPGDSAELTDFYKAISECPFSPPSTRSIDTEVIILLHRHFSCTTAIVRQRIGGKERFTRRAVGGSIR